MIVESAQTQVVAGSENKIKFICIVLWSIASIGGQETRRAILRVFTRSSIMSNDFHWRAKDYLHGCFYQQSATRSPIHKPSACCHAMFAAFGTSLLAGAIDAIEASA